MPPAGTQLTVSVLARYLRAELFLADIQPIFGAQTHITRFAIKPDSVQVGDTYIHCGETYSLLKDIMQAYDRGANGIVCASNIPPLAGSFCVQVKSVDFMINSLYPYIQRCLIEDRVELPNLLLRQPRVA